MKPRSWSLIVAASVSAIALPLQLSAAPPSEPVRVENTQRMTATVDAIDHDARLVELRSGDEVTTVQVPEEVRNFDQMKVGDQVVVTYHQGIAAQFKKKGESQTTGQVEMAQGVGRSEPGAKPGGVVANAVTTTVVIEGVDRDSNAVTFTGPTGMKRTVQVKDPKAQQFIHTLKKGDEVELTYTEALAVAVQEAKPQRQ